MQQKLKFLSDIIAHRRTFSGGALPRDLADAIAAAPKFVMDNDFLKVAMDVSVTDCNSIIKALPNSKPPFPKFWIEYDWAEFMRIAFGDHILERKWIKGIRKGAFIELCPDNPEVLLINFVQFDHGVLRHPDFEGKLNVAGKYAVPECPTILSDFIQLVQDAALVGWCAAVDPRFDNPEFQKNNEESLKILIDVFSLCCSRFKRSIWMKAAEEMEQTGHKFTAPLQKDIAMTCGHLGLETRLLASAICLLNSKNVSDSVSVTNAGKTITEKDNSYKGDVYHLLTIKLNRAQLNRAHSQGKDALTEIRRHKVRGHFKVRKTGVFWWSSFERGNPDVGYVHKDYLLQE